MLIYLRDVQLKLREQGWKEVASKNNKTVYFEKEGEKYGVVLTDTGNCSALILDSKYMDKLKEADYPYIFIKVKSAGVFIPFIDIGSKSIRLHRYLTNAPKDKEVDHKNHCYFFLTEENLRICDTRDNLKNTCKVLDTKVTYSFYHKGCCYTIKYKSGLLDEKEWKKIESLYEKKGFFITRLKYERKFVSKCYASPKEAYLSLRELEEKVKKDFAYQLENDFYNGEDLLLACYIFHEISEKEMYRENVKRICEARNKDGLIGYARIS